jgi:TonB family protein
MPSVKHFVEAPYPPEADKEHVEGSVLLEIDVGADGKVAKATVIQPAGHGFDEAAVKAVLQFDFEPAEIDHVPAAVRLQYKYDFVLRAPPPPPPQAEPPPPPGIVNFEGKLLERGTRDPLKNAGIQLTHEGKTYDAEPDIEGHFLFKDLPPGKYTVVVLAADSDRFETTEEVFADKSTSVKYYVRHHVSEYELTVRAPREEKEVTRRTLTAEEIQKIPGTQGDAIRVVQSLPGVARTPLGLGPLIVRGGRAGDTRTYVDGMLVPILFHFGGIRAVINSDFLDTLDFYPGNLPSKYGRSTAGAVDINTRDGKRDRIHGYADVSLMEATLFLEGPLGPRGAFMASVRRSYIDVLLPIIFKITGNSIGDFQVARYWDYQLKADFDLGRDHLSFFLFGSDDRLVLVFQNPTQISTEGRSSFSTDLAFHRFNTSWRRNVETGVTNKLSLTLGTQLTTNSLGSDIYIDLTLNTIFLRDELTWTQSNKLEFNFGTDIILDEFIYSVEGPPFPRAGEIFNPVLGNQLQSVRDTGVDFEPGIYAQAIYKPVTGLKLIPGMRVDYMSYIHRFWFDPSITAIYEFSPKFLVKGAIGNYHQPPTPEKLTRTFGNPNLIEEGSTQYTAGFEVKPAELWSVDLQFYYKDLYDEAARGQDLSASAAQAALGGQPYANLQSGRAYGAELLVRRLLGKNFFGWMALSLGNVERRQGPTAPLVESAFDQRFNLVTVASYKLPQDWEIGLRWQLTDGNPRTQLLGGVYNADADTYVPIPSTQLRAQRLPTFSQVDLRVDRRWFFQRWILDVYVDILNVLYTKNVEGLNPNFDYSQSRPFYGLPIFPAFGLRGEY